MTRNKYVPMNKEPRKAEATTSYAETDAGFLDPISTLGKLHPYPISLLAALRNIILSGSRITPKASIESSDFDFYFPKNINSTDIENFMCVLDSAKIKWNNSLQGIVEDVVKHGRAIVPCETFISLAKAFPTYVCGEGKLLKYLQDRFNSDGRSHLTSFLSEFNAEFERYQESEQLSRISRRYSPDTRPVSRNIYVWEFGKPPRTIEPPESFTRIIDTIVAMLDETYDFSKEENYEKQVGELLKSYFAHPSVRPKEESDEESLISDDEESLISDDEDDKRREKTFGAEIIEFRETLEKQRVFQDLLRKYLSYQVFLKRVYRSRSQINSLVDQIFEFPGTWDPKTGSMGYSWLRILRGTSEAGIKVQLMLVPLPLERKSGILRAVLDFYATHPMGFISATLGAHFYYKTAEKQISLKMNFSRDLRQAHAEGGITKMKKRNWTFEEQSKEYEVRLATKDYVKKVDYKEIYKRALQEVPKDQPLITRLKGLCVSEAWWERYFSLTESAFETYSWQERNGRITEIKNSRIRYPWQWTSEQSLLEWVHTALDGHADVIPKKEWDGRDKLKSKLNLWFAGVRTTSNISHSECLI